MRNCHVHWNLTLTVRLSLKSPGTHGGEPEPINRRCANKLGAYCFPRNERMHHHAYLLHVFMAQKSRISRTQPIISYTSGYSLCKGIEVSTIRRSSSTTRRM